jgi:UDP-3-O-acyl-N-acetylglucosamine deacetylase
LEEHRGGHAIHTALAAEILRQQDAWQFTESPERAVSRGTRVSVPASQPASR